MRGLAKDLKPAEYQALAEFRYQVRRFLRFSEQVASKSGLEPRQHQLLLALKALNQWGQPTVRDLAERLQLRHHSVVGLIDRLVERKLVKRQRSETDKRQVHVALTAKGEEMLRRLSLDHRSELQTAGPALLRALNALLNSNPKKKVRTAG